MPTPLERLIFLRWLIENRHTPADLRHVSPRKPAGRETDCPARYPVIAANRSRRFPSGYSAPNLWDVSLNQSRLVMLITAPNGPLEIAGKPPLSNCVERIVSGVPTEKVIGPDARGVVAAMKHHWPRHRGLVRQLIRYVSRAHFSSADHETTVPIWPFRPGPEPAVPQCGDVLRNRPVPINLCPEAVFNVAGLRLPRTRQRTTRESLCGNSLRDSINTGSADVAGRQDFPCAVRNARTCTGAMGLFRPGRTREQRPALDARHIDRGTLITHQATPGVSPRQLTLRGGTLLPQLYPGRLEHYPCGEPSGPLVALRDAVARGRAG
jgi:hypothetical protein